ncbi:hypothetical protein Q5H91_04250 [Sphingomonas sp. KR1UV-12]|uniref:HEPN domain-containing protein n=1 Tax=Sphingomonas aurea TaxID=3063994 RepID=A0ABT9EHG8_9SPHN|nr:hypothetical protein [Sphingomonas sp. KR1UV-12]MDP1026414.1 hypothetical protein [Sphingomonas sp. KR1UV-12]
MNNYMASKDALLSARAKLNRADQFLVAAEHRLRAFCNSKPFKIEYDGRYRDHYWSIQIDENIPVEVMLEIGDAIHALRSALDHSAFAFWLLDGKGTAENKLNEKTVCFPVEDAAEKFFARVQLLGLKPDAQAVFNSFGAYLGGPGEMICELSALDNADKHRILIPANIRIIIDGLKRSFRVSGCEETTEDVDTITLNVESGYQYAHTTNRMGQPIFAIHHLKSLPSHYGGKVDSSLAKIKIEVQLTKHKAEPLSEHPYTAIESLVVMTHSVHDVVRKLQDVLDARVKV